MSPTRPNVLLVDDESDILELLSMTLDRMDLASETAANVQDAIVQLNSISFDLCLTDLRLPDGNGMEIVNFIQQNIPKMPVAVISAHGDMQTAIDAMKAGAFDFISKPIDLNRLRALIESAVALDDSLVGTKFSKSGPQLLGKSASIQHIKEQITRLARSMAPVHIRGESGTGKELVARLIHDCSPRKNSPFIAVNSSAIPTELMESEFFGHRKGSFTGAVSDNLGLFQAAKGGTLFLDEIADLPLSMQAKLLRAIQERAIRPVGSHEETAIDCRILSATHQDLKKLVAHNKFREDLYYRINVIDINVPPLRSRTEDIAVLTTHILEKIAERNGITIPKIGHEVIEILSLHSFPGNVRELENILERAVALGDDNTLSVKDLKLPAAIETPVSSASSRMQNETLDEFLQRIETKQILNALKHNGNNKTRAAESLGISFRSFRYKLKKISLAE